VVVYTKIIKRIYMKFVNIYEIRKSYKCSQLVLKNQLKLGGKKIAKNKFHIHLIKIWLVEEGTNGLKITIDNNFDTKLKNTNSNDETFE
jgi:hypothetical protein